jgi:hypothetical protein
LYYIDSESLLGHSPLPPVHDAHTRSNTTILHGDLVEFVV